MVIFFFTKLYKHHIEIYMSGSEYLLWSYRKFEKNVFFSQDTLLIPCTILKMPQIQQSLISGALCIAMSSSQRECQAPAPSSAAQIMSRSCTDSHAYVCMASSDKGHFSFNINWYFTWPGIYPDSRVMYPKTGFL